MSGSASLGLEQAVLGHTLGFAPMAFPAQVFVGLCSAATPPSEAAPGTEVTGIGYTRMPATFALVATPSNIAANTTSIEFPIAGSPWGAIGYFELWDAQIGGNRLYWGQLIDPATELPLVVPVAAGDIMRFSPGALGVQAATGTGGTGSVGAYLPLGGGTLSGPLILAGDPTQLLGAATMQYVNAHSGTGGGTGFLPIGGGTLTGALTLVGDAALALQPVTLQQLNAKFVGGPWLPLSGGTVTGPLTVSGAVTAGSLSTGGTLVVSGATRLNQIGFYNTPSVALQSVTGSRGGNAALASLLVALAATGLIANGTST